MGHSVRIVAVILFERGVLATVLALLWRQELIFT
jgi:hypothetical protein